MSSEFSADTVAQGNSDLPPTLLGLAAGAFSPLCHSFIHRVHLIGTLWHEKPTPPTLMYALAKGSMIFNCVSWTTIPPNPWKEKWPAIISLGPHVKGITWARQWVSNTLLFRKATHCQWWRQVSRCKRGLRHIQISLHSLNHLDPTS